MRHPTDTVMFSLLGLSSALFNRVDVELGGSVRLEAAFVLKDGRVIPFDFRGAARADTGYFMPMVMQLLASMNSIEENIDAALEIDRIQYKFTRLAGVEIAGLVGVTEPEAISPDTTTLPLDLRFRTYRQKERYLSKQVPLRLPKGLREGNYPLMVAVGYSAIAFEQEVGLLPAGMNVDDQIRTLQRVPGPSQVSIYMHVGQEGVRIPGQRVAGLNAKLRAALPGATFEKRWIRLGQYDMDKWVLGQMPTTIRVRKKGYDE